MDDIIVANTQYLTPNYRKSKNQYEKVYSNYSFKIILEDKDGTHHMFDTLTKEFDEVEQIPTTESLLPDGLKKDEATQAKKKTDKIIQNLSVPFNPYLYDLSETEISHQSGSSRILTPAQ